MIPRLDAVEGWREAVGAEMQRCRFEDFGRTILSQSEYHEIVQA
jgi:hypothetical protein